MDITEIKALAEIFRDCGLTALEVRDGERRVRLEKSAAPQFGTQPVIGNTPTPTTPPAKLVEDVQGMDFKDITEIKTPVVGVFYTAPSPESQPFVKIGTKVKKGDVLCIVEAMKLMNEITAEQDGEIFDICAKDGQIVEFGQTIFKII